MERQVLLAAVAYLALHHEGPLLPELQHYPEHVDLPLGAQALQEDVECDDGAGAAHARTARGRARSAPGSSQNRSAPWQTRGGIFQRVDWGQDLLTPPKRVVKD